MPERMLRFVNVPHQGPAKRAVAERRRDFREIYRIFSDAEAATQSSRCSQCGVPFCSVHCPLSNNIPDWLKLATEGRLEEAYEVSSATNNFPEICGRICPQDRLCEGNCVIEKGYESVTIGSVERYITDTAFERGWVQPIRPRRELDRSIGIIGAGPGGLAAAEQLRRRGYKVTVYDRHDRAGGLLIYGIPNFKLEKEVVLRRHALCEASGIRFELNCEIGRDLSFEHLRRRHDAVLIATGVYKARELGGPGIGLPGIVPALDYLIAFEPRESRRPRARVHLRRAERTGQSGSGDWWRRHGYGLCSHRCPPRRQIGEMPLPPRPREHAGFDAGGEECRGGRRGVRLALHSRGFHRPR